MLVLILTFDFSPSPNVRGNQCSLSQNVVFGMINYAGEHFVGLIEGLALMRQGGGDTPEILARICVLFQVMGTTLSRRAQLS